MEFDWLSHGFGTRHAIPPVEPMATVKQIHSPEVRVAHGSGLQGTADALISLNPGLLLAVKTADCLPILLIDTKRRVFAAVHAGWRGTAAGIAGRAVKSMQAELGAEPQDMEAAIGPGIGCCCFEVGPEVAREFGPWESVSKTRLDLSKINRSQLEATGLHTVHEARLCTMCGSGFFSFRREGEKAGRMISFAGRKF